MGSRAAKNARHGRFVYRWILSADGSISLRHMRVCLGTSQNGFGHNTAHRAPQRTAVAKYACRRRLPCYRPIIGPWYAPLAFQQQMPQSHAFRSLLSPPNLLCQQAVFCCPRQMASSGRLASFAAGGHHRRGWEPNSELARPHDRQHLPNRHLASSQSTPTR